MAPYGCVRYRCQDGWSSREESVLCCLVRIWDEYGTNLDEHHTTSPDEGFGWLMVITI